MERHFDKELASLKQEILCMGGLVDDQIIKSIEALKSLDRFAAEMVIACDKKVDEKEIKIDDICLDLLALHQPVALDLRFIAMSMKITTDLERMADLAVDIAQRVIELADKPMLKPLIDIPKLAVLAQMMTRDALNAFLKPDSAIAKKVISDDQEADRLRNYVQTELIQDFMIKDSSSVDRAVPLLLIARHLERICDHATNIAEDVIYMVEAKVVKHHPENIIR